MGTQKKQIMTLQEVQKELLIMMINVFDYCEQHNIRCIMYGGTLLGAVRHKGFIPWDDDVDLCMPRNDYDRFIELTRKEKISDDYIVLSGECGEIGLPFIKLLNKKIMTDEFNYVKEKWQINNLFLDILPMDGWPSDDKKAHQLLWRTNAMRFMLKESKAQIGEGRTFARKVLKIPAVLVSKMVGTDRLVKQLIRTARETDFDQAEYAGCVTFGIYGFGERIRKDEALNMVKLEFEGHLFNAPGCWDKYLSGIYGNYMELPPVKKRQVHHVGFYKVDQGEQI